MGLGKNEFNVMENHLGFSKSDRNGEVALLVNRLSTILYLWHITLTGNQEAAGDGSRSSAEHGVDMEEQRYEFGTQSEVP